MGEPHSLQLTIGGTPPFRFGLSTCGGDLRGVEVDGADKGLWSDTSGAGLESAIKNLISFGDRFITRETSQKSPPQTVTELQFRPVFYDNAEFSLSCDQREESGFPLYLRLCVGKDSPPNKSAIGFAAIFST
jgi:hypothetical protein